MKIAKFYVLIIITMLISGCISRIDPYEENITSVEIFQKAYEATDTRNFSLAISYYEAFIERFPDDVKGCIWAQYEIAFLYHKMGKDEKCLELLKELLAKYEADDSKSYPEAPKVLAEKVIQSISGKKDTDKTTE